MPTAQERRRQRAERRAREAFVIYIEEGGSVKKAAHRLRVAESTIRHRLADYLRDSGHQTLVQAAYHLDR